MSRSPDLRHRDPEVRKERVKLLANGLNAVGLALIIGGLVAPILDPAKPFSLLRVGAAVVVGGLLVLAAFGVLRYMKPLEAD